MKEIIEPLSYATIKVVKYFIVVPVIALLGVTAGFIFLPISRFNPDAKQADQIMETKTRYYAFRFYQAAEKSWPLLKYNVDFQNKYKKAEAARGDYSIINPAVRIFLKDGTTDTQVHDLVAKLEKFDYIAKVHYQSKEEAAQSYIDGIKNNKLYSDELKKEFLPPKVKLDNLPAVIYVYLSDWGKQTAVQDLLRDNPIISESDLTPKLF